MTTIEVQPVTHDAFDRVWPLLNEGFDAKQMSQEDWRRMLFGYGWHNEGDPYGYLLLDKERAVGFLGSIFSTQRVGARTARFCNLSSWIVKPEYRMGALSLLRPVLADRACTFTNLTPIGATAKILQRFGFTELETEAWVMSPLSGLLRARPLRRCSFTHDLDEIEARLSGNDLEIFRHHKGASCGHLLLEWSDGRCYLLTTKWVLKGRHVRYVHHVSDLDLFWERLGCVQWALLRTHGSWFTMIDRRRAGGREAPLGLAYKFRLPRLYRPSSEGDIEPQDVSALYSELMWLRV